MRRLHTTVAVLAACSLAGCSIFFNPDDLVGGDGAVDSGMDSNVDGDTSVDTMSDAQPPDTSVDGGADWTFCETLALPQILNDPSGDVLGLAAVASPAGGARAGLGWQDGSDLMLTTLTTTTQNDVNLSSTGRFPLAPYAMAVGRGREAGTFSVLALGDGDGGSAGVFWGVISVGDTIRDSLVPMATDSIGAWPAAVLGAENAVPRFVYREEGEFIEGQRETRYLSIPVGPDPPVGLQTRLPAEDVPSNITQRPWGTGSTGFLALLDDAEPSDDEMQLWDGVSAVGTSVDVNDGLYQSSLAYLGGGQYRLVSLPADGSAGYLIQPLIAEESCTAGLEQCTALDGLMMGNRETVTRAAEEAALIAATGAPGVGYAVALFEQESTGAWMLRLHIHRPDGTAATDADGPIVAEFGPYADARPVALEVAAVRLEASVTVWVATILEHSAGNNVVVQYWNGDLCNPL